MASSYRNSTTRSTSPTDRHSRVTDPVQVAPYLTHVVRHHGQVTLVPPENAGRIRKARKKRPAAVRGESSTTSLDSPRASAPHSRPNTPRPHSASSIPITRNGATRSTRGGPSSRGTQEDLLPDILPIPDFPPPSFEEAMMSTPSPRNPSPSSFDNAQSSVGHNVCDPTEQNIMHDYCPSSVVPTAETAPPPSSDTETLSPNSSHSSLEELVDGKPPSLWEQDREAGYALEERVQRELERRKLADSLPRAPVMRLTEADIFVSESGIAQSSHSEIRELHRLNGAKPSIHQQLPSPCEAGVSPSGLPNHEQGVSPEDPELSSTSPITRTFKPSCSGRPVHDSSKGKEKERQIARDEAPLIDLSSEIAPNEKSSETSPSKLREVLNTPSWPRLIRSDLESNGNSSQESWCLVTPRRSSSAEQYPGSSFGTSRATRPASQRASSSMYDSLSIHDTASQPPSEGSSDILLVDSAATSMTSPSNSTFLEPSRHLPTPPCSSYTTLESPSPAQRIPSPMSSTRVSVRDRINAFESLQDRPIPPPPMRPVVGRPPPPVPGSSNAGSAREPFNRPVVCLSSTPASTVTSRGSENCPFPARRGLPLPIPAQRRRPENTVPAQSETNSSTVLSLPPSAQSSAPAIPAPSTILAANGSANIESSGSSYSIDPNSLPVQGSTTLSSETCEDTGATSSIAPPSGACTISPPPFITHSLPNEDQLVSFHGITDHSSAGRRIATDGLESQLPSEPVPGNTHADESTPMSISTNYASIPAETSNSLSEPAAEPVSQDQPTENPVTSTEPSGLLHPMFTGLTDLDLLLARLDDPDFTYGGRSYDDLLLLEEMMGPALGDPNQHRTKFEDVPLGRVEVLRRRVTKDGRVKLKLALLGVVVDKCGICLAQFKGDVFACLSPCRHAFHENCLSLWMRRGQTCPLCRGPLCVS